MRRLVLALAAASLMGCVRLAPWERGLLAQQAMQPPRDPLEVACDAHVAGARDAMMGASYGGTPCGCR